MENKLSSDESWLRRIKKFARDNTMATETPPLQPITPGYRVNILGAEQLDQLQAATLEILEDVGVHCPSEKALKIYIEHGATVDFATQIVKLPRQVVMDALSHSPRFYTMGARNPDFDLILDGKSMYCATDGCGVETIDFITRERRRSKKDDVAVMARVSDYLSALSFYWPIVSAQDFPATAPLHEIDASFNNTVKHVQSETIMGEWTAHYAIEMADVIAGNEHNRRSRPPLSLLVCTVAPLAQDKDGLESALLFAEAGLPVGFMSMVNIASTAPATIAGTLVTGDAEIVSALVLMQMAHPGAPVFHSLLPGTMHPHTGAYLSSTLEGSQLYPIGVEMAHRWGVPTLAGIFGTDAQVPGWQSAAEAESSLLLCALAGAETGSGLGLVESCTLLYPESILLDSDVYQRVRIEASRLDTSPDAMALDVIKQVGPRGHFLAHRHTRTNLRQRQFSELTGQPRQEGGFREPVDVARDKLDWILANHYPQPMEDAQKSELSRILKSADREKGQ
jgi:trimethylamine---corrinoid protein Co-methyltransferase